MRLFYRSFPGVLIALLAVSVPSIALAFNGGVVIGEFAVRGQASGADEFVELYNPGDNAVSLSGWKLQYHSAGGSTWLDRATLPANASIPGHGFFLIANTSYAGVTPDFTSGSWTSGTGMGDDGNMRVINASAVVVDKVAWGTGNDPEGGAGHQAPTYGSTANNNSIERKALANSDANTLAAGGAHELLGNGYDTNVNNADFVQQIHGRHPQNTLSSPEPAFSSNGNGTGLVSMHPTVVNANAAVPQLLFSVMQDSAYALSYIAIKVPADWTWSHNASDVTLSGPGFASAVAGVNGDSIVVTQAAITMSDTGAVILAGATSTGTVGTSLFPVQTAVFNGVPAQILTHPRLRVINLVPIVSVHVNDSQGVPVSPYQVGGEATITGVVTANFSNQRTDLYLQDVTGGMNVFSFLLPGSPISVGDSITVTGTILQFRGLTELTPDFSLLVRHASGKPLPDPLVMTCAQLNATFHNDHTEPNESRLIRINGVTYDGTSSTITDATGTSYAFLGSLTPPGAFFDVIGLLKQFKCPSCTQDPGAPYTSDYEIAPRISDDMIVHTGPVILNRFPEDNITPSSVRLRYTTNNSSSSVVQYGTTPALGGEVTDATMTTDHVVTVPGLLPATAYYFRVGATDGTGTNYSTQRIFSTATPPPSTGEINVYFNSSVNTDLAWYQPANGNQDLSAKVITRINNAKRSLDVALYSLSGTVGDNVANAINQARARGLSVRVICEQDNRSSSSFNFLANAGVALITDSFDPINNGAGLMHNKFFVIDGRNGGQPDSAWVFTGSWNATQSGTFSDLQNAIEIQDQALANAYVMEFNEMWGSSGQIANAQVSRFGARKYDDTPHHFLIGGRSIDSYFSPSDSTNTKILQTLDAAQHSIGFQLLTLTRDDIGNELIAKKNAGLKVRGDLDNGTDSGSQYSALVGAGVDVRLKTGVSGLLHHKYLIVDAENPNWNPMTLTGSHNWSAAAENSNNENTLIIHDANITNQYLQEFGARYTQFGGTDPITVSVEQTSPRAAAFELSQNYPNPVTRLTGISYALPFAAQVSLKLYDVSGREVKTLVNQKQAPGTYRVGLSSGGLASGVYFYRFEAGSFVQQRKMLILK